MDGRTDWMKCNRVFVWSREFRHIVSQVKSTAPLPLNAASQRWVAALLARGKNVSVVRMRARLPASQLIEVQVVCRCITCIMQNYEIPILTLQSLIVGWLVSGLFDLCFKQNFIDFWEYYEFEQVIVVSKRGHFYFIFYRRHCNPIMLTKRRKREVGAGEVNCI